MSAEGRSMSREYEPSWVFSSELSGKAIYCHSSRASGARASRRRGPPQRSAASGRSRRRNGKGSDEREASQTARRPVTPEVAGSSPVGPANNQNQVVHGVRERTDRGSSSAGTGRISRTTAAANTL